ncbi:hypothetical protein ABIA35_008954 [Catenulispora sp. MAP12-49]
MIGTDFVAQRSYTPPAASAADYLRMLDATGMAYGVLFQVSVHGADNAVMLDVLRAQRDRLRGVAVVTPDVTDVELGRLADARVVGLRLNTLSGGGFGFDHIDRYEEICAELGWHLQLLTDTRRLEEVGSRIFRADLPCCRLPRARLRGRGHRRRAAAGRTADRPPLGRHPGEGPGAPRRRLGDVRRPRIQPHRAPVDGRQRLPATLLNEPSLAFS